MVNFKKIVNPCTCVCGGGKVAQTFCKITYIDGRLTISGVIGPTRGGNAVGSRGQCGEEIRNDKFALNKNWSEETFNKFLDIWEKWHLNDMHPECEHQRELGWVEEAREVMYQHNYVLINDELKKKNSIEKSILSRARNGEVIEPTEEEVDYLNLKDDFSVIKKTKEREETPFRYIYQKDSDYFTAVKKTTRGWIDYEIYPEYGILKKPCPVCGYKYGCGWKKVEVPTAVLEFLISRPDTEITPAWV